VKLHLKRVEVKTTSVFIPGCAMSKDFIPLNAVIKKSKSRVEQASNMMRQLLNSQQMSEERLEKWTEK
jgi:hypothetical protein